MNMTRIRITPRQLVHRHLGAVRLSAKAVATALSRACRRGYVANYTPPPHAFDQYMVLLPVTSPFAAFYRALADDGTATPVPRGLIESRFQMPIGNIATGMLLARLGLAIVHKADRCLILRGTTTTLAYDINLCRYSNDVSPVPTWLLVERATGIMIPPVRISDDIRRRAANVYAAYEVTIDGLLDGGSMGTLVPTWRFTAPTQRPAMPDDMAPPF